MDAKPTGLSGKNIKLQCQGDEGPGEELTVDEEVAKMSKIVKEMLHDLADGGMPADTAIPLKIQPDVMKEVVKYCVNYLQNPPPKEDEATKKLELNEWDKKFCEALDQKKLFAVILASNFLDVKPLLDVTCLFVALKLKSMTPEEIRKEYNITKEFTPEEEEKARKEFEEMILQTTAKK